VKDGASESVAEKSSYEVMSDKPPLVDMVKDEPDMRLELYVFSRLR
jgi:hypothetical protein